MAGALVTVKVNACMTVPCLFLMVTLGVRATGASSLGYIWQGSWKAVAVLRPQDREADRIQRPWREGSRTGDLGHGRTEGADVTARCLGG